MPSFDARLSANELLFFPKQNKLRSFRQEKASPEDLNRKRNYLQKIKGKSFKEKRELRGKFDARYLHKNANNSSEMSSTTQTPDEKEFCLDHLTGRCNNKCGRWHQMRHLRLFGVCKFYIAGRCANGDSCVFMHEEFPCRFYHLDLKHPTSKDGSDCRFKHGGPLSEHLCRYFRRQIEIWTKKITANKPEQFEDKLADLLHRFDSKQSKLQQELRIDNIGCSSMDSNSNGAPLDGSERFSIESILSTKEINKLKEMHIMTVAQINRSPVEQLLECGLTMDQIYEITTRTCHEIIQCDESTQQSVTCDELPNDSSNHDLSILNNLNFEFKENSFQGFTNSELTEAMEIFAMKQHIFQIDEHEIEIRADTPTDGKDQETSDIVGQKHTSEMSQYDANTTDDSDNEFDLIINEDD